MNTNNALLIIAAVVLIVAALSLGFTYYSISSFKDSLFTGYVTQNGTIYLNITSTASINMTTNVINWSNGSLNQGAVYAVLSTSDNSVTNGTWQQVGSGFRVENNGNVNVSLSIKSGKTNASFIGGTGPMYMWNISNVDPSSCTNTSGVNLAVEFTDVNNTGKTICDVFEFVDARDTIEIDIKLGVPYDAPAVSAMLTDQIEVTASEV